MRAECTFMAHMNRQPRTGVSAERTYTGNTDTSSVVITRRDYLALVACSETVFQKLLYICKDTLLCRYLSGKTKRPKYDGSPSFLCSFKHNRSTAKWVALTWWHRRWQFHFPLFFIDPRRNGGTGGCFVSLTIRRKERGHQCSLENHRLNVTGVQPLSVDHEAHFFNAPSNDRAAVSWSSVAKTVCDTQNVHVNN